MASTKLSTLKSIGYLPEAESSYGVSLSGSSTYNSLRFVEGTIEKQVEMLDNQLAEQYIHGTRPKIVGRRRVKVSIKSHMYGAPTAMSGTNVPGRHDQMDLLGVIMGGGIVTSGSAVASTSATAGSVAVTAGHGIRFPNKSVYGLFISGTLQCRPVLSKSTDTVVPHFAHSVLPTAGDLIYGGHHVYLAQDPTGSLQFHMIGHSTFDNFVALGCQGNIGIEAALGQTPFISYDLMGASWLTGSNSTALSRVSYGTSIPPVFKDSRVHLYTITSGTVASAPLNLPLKSISWTPGLQHADVMSAGDIENIVDKVATRNAAGTMTCELQVYFNDRSYFTSRDAATEYGLFVQIVNARGGTVCVFMPRCQIVNVVQNDADGLSGQTLSILILDDNVTNNQSGTNDITDLNWSSFTISAL